MNILTRKNMYGIAGIAILIALAGAFIWQKKKIKTLEVPEEAPQSVQTPATKSAQPANGSASVNQNQSSPTIAKQATKQTAKPEQFIISYTDNGYSPAVLTIHAGDFVTFQNRSSHLMWTASNPHPIHTAYPVTGGCIGSAFDECGAVGSGQQWAFQFSVKGMWQYHNHLAPRDGGLIVVQ